MATLQKAIDQIQTEVGAISGIRAAPDEPPDQISVYPFAVCFADNGTYDIGPPEVMTGLHTITLELHIARKDLTRDVQKAMVYAKSIPNAIYKGFTDGNLAAIATLSTIRYEFGALGWGGIDTLGFRFFIEGVKTQDAIA